MDGLSVAASIAGLVSIADIVVRRGYKYVRDVKDAEKSVAILIEEVNKLSGIIHSLENVARQCEDEKYEIESTTQVHQIEACLKTLQSIELHLKESDPATATENSDRIKRKLKWTLNKSKVRELMLEVERHQSAMSLAMKASGMSSLLNLLAGQHEVHDILLQLRRDIDGDRVEREKITMTDQRKKWFQALGNVEAQRWQNSNIKLRQPGTGVWFTDGPEFNDWLMTSSSRLWVHGIPGAGKTILMSTVIQEAQKYTSQSRALAFFYCDYKDPSTHNPVNIIGSLVKQLTMQKPELCFKVIEEWYTALQFLNDGTPSVDTDKICDLMKQLSVLFANIMIIIDGLDEISINRADVTNILQGLNIPCGNIKTLFASRNETDLQHPLREYRQISIAARSSDIRLYVGSEIEMRTRKQQMRIHDPDLKMYIMETLVDKAEGMFRWVACQLDYLCECTNDRERREALSKLPPDLPKSYERILERVNNSKNKANRQLVIRTLQLICFTRKPLSTKALLEAISVNDGDIDLDPHSTTTDDEVLLWCSSLVRRRAGGGFELAHFTVKEFLLAIDLVQSPQFFQYRMSDSAHFDIARNCLTYLNAKSFAAFSRVPRDFLQLLEKHPFIVYAVKFWNHHAFNFGEDASVLQLACRLFSPDTSEQFLLYISMIYQIYSYEIFFEGEDGDEVLEHPILKFAEWNVGELEVPCGPISNPLHYAAALGLPSVCAWLIEQKQDVNHVSDRGSPLCCAVAGLDAVLGIDEAEEDIFVHPKCSLRCETVQVLLSAGATPEIAPPPDSDLSLIWIAILAGDEEICDNILAAGVQVQAEPLIQWRRVIISKSIHHQRLCSDNMTNWLFRQHINSIATDAHGELFSLCLAWFISDFWEGQFVDIPIVLTIPPPKEDSQEWMHEALRDGIGGGDIPSFFVFLYENLLLQGKSLLTYDCLVQVLKKLLLEAVQGCDCCFLSNMIEDMNHNAVNLSDILSELDVEEVLLHLAILAKEEDSSRYQTIKNLIECGQDVTEQDSQGATSFHIAARIGDLKTFELLWQAEEEPEALLIGDNEGRTAQDYAASSGNLAIVDFISQKCGRLQYHNGVRQETLLSIYEIVEQTLPLRQVQRENVPASGYGPPDPTTAPITNYEMEMELASQSDIEMNDMELQISESVSSSHFGMENQNYPAVSSPRAVVFKLLPLSSAEISQLDQKLGTLRDSSGNLDGGPTYLAWQVNHSPTGNIHQDHCQALVILGSEATTLHRGIVKSAKVYGRAN